MHLKDSGESTTRTGRQLMLWPRDPLSLAQLCVCVCARDLLWLAMARQLHGDSGQICGVGEGEEGGAGASGEHVLLHLRSLVAPQPGTKEEQREQQQEQVGSGAWRRHGGATLTTEMFQYKVRKFEIKVIAFRNKSWPIETRRVSFSHAIGQKEF